MDRITGVEPGVASGAACHSDTVSLPGFTRRGGDRSTRRVVGDGGDQLHASTRGGYRRAIELLAVRPGQVLELAAEIESVDTDTVAYPKHRHGRCPVIRLRIASVHGRRRRSSMILGPRDRRQLSNSGVTPALAARRLSTSKSAAANPASQRGRFGRIRRPFAEHFRAPGFSRNVAHAPTCRPPLRCRRGVCGDGVVGPRVVSNVKLRTFIPLR